MGRRNALAWLADGVTSAVGRWVVVGLWLVAAVVLRVTAPTLASLYNDKATSSIGNPESAQAARILSDAFPAQQAIPAIIVFYDAAGLTAGDQQVATQVACWLASDGQRAAPGCAGARVGAARPGHVGPVVALATLPQARSELVSRDGTTETVIVALTAQQDDTTTIQQTVRSIRAYTDAQASPSLQINVTGPAGIVADLINVFAGADVKLLLATVVLVLVLLALIYRSPLLALLPIISVGWALQVITGLLGFAAQARLFPIGQQPISIMDVLLFGAGTDYTIFIVARLREERQRERDPLKALRATMYGVGEAITSSAGTVILGLLTLTLATLGLYSALGLVLAIAVAVMLLAGLTLIPALLSILGSAAFWPFVPRYVTAEQQAAAERAQERGFWQGIAAAVTRRPRAAVAGSLVLLGTLALGVIGVGPDFNSLQDLRSSTPSTRGYAILSRHFAPGSLAPLTVVMHWTHGGDAYTQLVALDAVTQAVGRAKDVALVTGPTRPDGNAPVIAPATLQQDFAQLPQAVKDAVRAGQFAGGGGAGGGAGGGGVGAALDPEVVGLYAATVASISRDGRTVALTVTLNSDPYGMSALDAMDGVRSAARSAATRAGLGPEVVSTQLTGVTPQLADTRAASARDTRLIVPLVLALVGIVLALLLRSLVAPLYLLAAVTLNFVAALGIASFIFTHAQGEMGIAYATPLYAFIFLVALGADYTIFLMSRVREESAKRGVTEGTRVALGKTGGVITSAGMILAGTFLALTILPLRTLADFGLTVAIGVLLDTFVVRGALIPGIVTLLGRANWWPGRGLQATNG